MKDSREKGVGGEERREGGEGEGIVALAVVRQVLLSTAVKELYKYIFLTAGCL